MRSSQEQATEKLEVFRRRNGTVEVGETWEKRLTSQAEGGVYHKSRRSELSPSNPLEVEG